MPIDRVRIYLTNIESIKDDIFLEQYNKWYIKKNTSKPLLSYYWKRIGCITVKYMPLNNGGTLYLEFNPSTMIFGDNIASLCCCNIQQLQNMIYNKLKGTIDISAVSNIRYWNVSRYENNINIIRDAGTIKALYNLISKLEKTKRLNKMIYEPEGTIYFFNGSSLESSDYIVKFYFKLRQIRNKINDASIGQYYNSEVVCLNPGEDILRMEITSGREIVVRHYKKEKYKWNGLVSEMIGAIPRNQIGTLEDIFNYDSQVYLLKKIINDFHLDKIMTTKGKLISFIDNSNLSLEEKKTAKTVIKHINNCSHKKKPAPSTIAKYKAWILSMGYHYMFADVEILPIDVDDIIKNLPYKQQHAIELYRDSNFFNDYMHSTIPSSIY
jgi:hypothetical protein